MEDKWTSFNKDTSSKASVLFEPTSLHSVNINSPFNTLTSGVYDNEGNVYYNNYNSISIGQPNTNPGGILISKRVDTGVINWFRYISEFSGLSFDYSSVSPCIHGNLLVIPSSIDVPQRLAPYENIVYAGTSIPVPVSKRRACIFIVDRKTGSLLYPIYVGNEAENVNSIDNWITFKSNPVVFDADKSLIAIGSSSNQSLAPFTYQGSEGNILGSLRSFRFTDQGRMLIIDLCKGEIVVDKSTCPALYVEGNPLLVSSMIPGRSSFLINHIVTEGELNPISRQFAGTQRVITTLLSGQRVPLFLEGIKVLDNSGQTVTLHAYEVVTATLDKVVVKTAILLDQGKSTFGNNIPTSTLVGSMIIKKLLPFDILTASDAYQCNYYGCMIESQPTIAFSRGKRCDRKKNGVFPLEVYFTSGSNVHIPLDEELYILENTSGKTFLDLNKETKDVQIAYQNDPTSQNLALIFANTEKNLNLELTRSKINLSMRGNTNLVDSVIALDIRQCNFGSVIWHYKTLGFDSFHYGYILTLRTSIQSGFSNVEDYYGSSRTQDGGFDSSVMLTRNQGNIYLVAVNKNDTSFVFALDLIPYQQTDPKVISVKKIGNGSYIGTKGNTCDTEIFGSSSLNNTVPLGETNFGSMQVPYPLFWYQLDGSAISDVYMTCQNIVNGHVRFQTSYSSSSNKIGDLSSSFVSFFSIDNLNVKRISKHTGNITATYSFTSSQIASRVNFDERRMILLTHNQSATIS